MQVAPVLSIVVAAAGAEASIEPCLAALGDATAHLPAEILIVGADERAGTRHDAAGVRSVAAPRDALVPVLWQRGLDESRGTFVGFLTAHALVDRSWADAMIGALSNEAVSGAGGSFRLASNAGAAVSAVFFLRFAKHLEDRWTAGPCQGDIAADNAVYRRADLAHAGLAAGTGFWEVEVHRQLRRQGRMFVAAAHATVTIVGAPPAARFLGERFRHGRRFGAWRSAVEVSRARVLLAAPIVPLVLTARMARRVWPVRKYRMRLVSALPWLLAFSTAWAAGEAAGALGLGVRS